MPAALVAWVAAWALTGPLVGWAGAVAVGAVLGSVGVGVVAVLASRPSQARERPRSEPRDPSRVGAARTATRHVVVALACLAAVSLAVHAQVARQAPMRSLAGQGAHAEVVGRVVSEPRPAVFGDGERWQLAMRHVTARGIASSAAGLVEVTADGSAPRYGATVAVSGVLRPVDEGDGP
ncbi:MAG TPA: DUF4131 domain-containing protein, partial [Isoptericola sp.]|nr:DUF4131 domain-containing protein [Isoptericola sp.]